MILRLELKEPIQHRFLFSCLANSFKPITIIPMSTSKGRTKKEYLARGIFLTVTIAVMALIFIQSAMPDYISSEESNIIVIFITSVIEKTGKTVSNRELIEFLVRKAAHFTEYALFGASLFATVRAFLGKRFVEKGKGGNRLLYLISWILGTLYAVTDEVHQLFVPGRYGKWTDVVIDSAGLALGALICLMIFRNRSR